MICAIGYFVQNLKTQMNDLVILREHFVSFKAFWIYFKATRFLFSFFFLFCFFDYFSLYSVDF